MQSFVDIPSSKTLGASLPDLLNNDKTLLSNNAGTTFPTTNLQQGMLCLRTDQGALGKLYQITNTDMANPVWTCILDLANVPFATGLANLISSGTDLNTLLTTGFYRGTTMTNAPDNGYWFVLVQAHSATYVTQTVTAFGNARNAVDQGVMYVRAMVAGAWGAWKEIWNSDQLSNVSQLTNDAGYQSKVNPELQSWRETVQALTITTATQAIDCSLANVFNINLNLSTTLSFTNVPASGKAYSVALFVKQDATGNRLITWPASVKWPNGTAPVLTTTASKTDLITLSTLDGGTTWFGNVGAKNY